MAGARGLETEHPSSGEERILVLAVGRDGTLTGEVLASAGLTCRLCSSVEELCREMESPAGAVVLAEELVTAGTAQCLAGFLERQPPWSDLPFLIVAGSDTRPERVLRSFGVLGNVSVLHRPLSIDTLISSLRSALRARRRQYEVRDLLGQREEALRQRDDFMAMLAHELRNPLAAICNAGHVLELGGTRDPELVARLLAIITRQSWHLCRLVDDLLDLSRITRGKVTLQQAPVEPRAVVQASVDATQGLIRSREHTLSVDLPPEPILVDGDATRLEQVLGNLLVNAAKYTEPGGQIRVSAERDRDQAVVRVRDSGIGIPPEMLARVFDLFQQVSPSADRSQGGLGIGLTLVRSLVELHGGTVEVFSDGPGRGSEFVVRLPIRKTKDEEGKTNDSPVTESRGAGKRLRILVVEDNADAGETLAELLELWGHEVRVVRDGAEALQVAPAYAPDVVLLDIGLPGLDGYEVARRLARNPATGQARLVALTGYGTVEDRRRSGEAGIHAHLVKPVDPNALKGLLEKAV